MAEKMRKAGAHSIKREATGRASSTNQSKLSYDVGTKRITAVFVADDASSSRLGEMDRPMYSQMLIKQSANTTRELEFDGGLGSGGGHDYVIRIEEVEDQVPVKSGREYFGRPHDARILFSEKLKFKHMSTTYFSSIRPGNCIEKFPNPGRTRHEHRPRAKFSFSTSKYYYFPLNSLLYLLQSSMPITGKKCL